MPIVLPRSTSLALVTILAALLATNASPSVIVLAAPAARYAITDLGGLAGPSSSFLEALDLNDRGHVVGEATALPANTNHAAVWNGNTLTDLGTLPTGDTSSAWGINARGQVVGAANEEVVSPVPVEGPIRAFRAVLWDRGHILELGTLGGLSSWAYGINQHGQVVGNARTANAQTHAFLWTRHAGMLDLKTLPGATDSTASHINDRGEVIGEAATSAGTFHAVSWRNGQIADLGTLGGQNSQSWGLNQHGQVAGVAQDTAGIGHAVVWSGGGAVRMTPEPGGRGSTARDINDAGEVVGDAGGNPYNFTPGELRAVLWKGNTAVDLTAALPEGSGWEVLDSATGINDRGQIIGTGTHNGKPRGFLLTPVDPKHQPRDLDADADDQ